MSPILQTARDRLEPERINQRLGADKDWKASLSAPNLWAKLNGERFYPLN
jgi:hypothetical protein